jgi:BRCT domain type II-containing protein
MPVKRELSSEVESGSVSDQAPRTPTPKKSKAAATSPDKANSSPSKANRLPSSSKRDIAEEIIKAGIAAVNVDQIAKSVGQLPIVNLIEIDGR